MCVCQFVSRWRQVLGNCHTTHKPKFHLARLDTFDFVEPCFSNMADDEEAVVLACTSLVFCVLSVHVNNTEKIQHAVWVKDYLKKREIILF